MPNRTAAGRRLRRSVLPASWLDVGCSGAPAAARVRTPKTAAQILGMSWVVGPGVVVEVGALDVGHQGPRGSAGVAQNGGRSMLAVELYLRGRYKRAARRGDPTAAEIVESRWGRGEEWATEAWFRARRDTDSL